MSEQSIIVADEYRKRGSVAVVICAGVIHQARQNERDSQAKRRPKLRIVK